MKVNFDYTLNDYKKYLFKSRITNNIFLFIIGLIVYLYFSLNKISLSFLPLFILGLIVAIFLLNTLYVFLQIKVNNILNNNVCGKYILELTPNKFSVTINKVKIDYKYKQIKKVKEKKNSFLLKFIKNKDSLIFEKKFFTDEEYNRVINIFKEKINKI